MPENPPSYKGVRDSDSGENTSIRKRYVLYVEPVRSGYGHQFMVSPDWQAKSEGYRETPMKISLASPVEVELPKSGTGEVEESGREPKPKPEHPVPQQSESNGQVPFREHEHSTSEEDHDHRHSATRPAPSSVQMAQSTVLRVASEHPATSQSSKLETTHSSVGSASGTQRQTTPSHTSYTVSVHSSIASASETLLAAETASTQEPSSLSSTELPTSSSVEGSSTMYTVSVPVASTNGTGVAPTPVALSSALHTPPVYISIVVGCIAFIAMLAAVIGWAIRVRSSTRRRWNERISIRRLDSDGSGSGGIRSWWTLPFMHRAGSGRESMATIQNDHVAVDPVHLQVPHPSQSDGIDFPSSLGDTGGLNVGGEFGMGSGTELPMRRTLSSKRRHQRADSDTIRSEMVQNHHPRSRQSTLQSYRFPNPFEWQEPPSPPMPEAEVHVEEQQCQPSSGVRNDQPQLPRMDSFGLGVGLGLNLDSMRGLHVMNRSAGDGTSIATDRSAEGSSRAGTSMVVNDSANPTPSTSAAYLNPKDVDVTEATPMNTISSFPTMPSFPSMLNTIKTTFNAAFSPSTLVEEDKYTRAPTRLRNAEILGDDHENPGEGPADPSKQRVRPLSVNKKKYSAAKFEGRENGVRSRSKRLNRRLTGLVSDALKPNPTSRGISRRSRSRMQRLKSSSRESHEANEGDDVPDYYATEPHNFDTERRPSFLSRSSSSGQSTSSQSSQRSDAPSFMSDISTSSSKDEVMTEREREARDMLLFSRSQAN